MKILEMAELLYSKSEELGEEAEINVEIEDMLYDFTIETQEEVFDGFDTFYPEGLKIVLKKENEDRY